MKTLHKLAILADAAKYDASCASSGSIKRDSKKGKGIGSTSGGMGICHSYTPDGRCVSLLKILLTNFCIYDCSYCINRSSSDVQRARFSVEEIVNLTLDFYKRNYIEGLFLSSGIIQSSDYTMEQLVSVAKTLRKTHDFRGYIHLKTIPDASPELLQQAGLYADRLSINIELPSKKSLKQYAPEKDPSTIHQSMTQLKDHIDESKESRTQKKSAVTVTRRSGEKKKSLVYSPAGQSTQMIVGADESSDKKILTLSHYLYNKYSMRRVYYSAFSPIPDASAVLPIKSPPLMREHRLYQADWLLRFYGFNVNEISENNSANDGMLDLEIDPKLAWAINHREFFPVNINTATREDLLRVPGIGAIGASRIIQSRNFRRLRYQDLKKIGVSVSKVSAFIETQDHTPKQLDSQYLRQSFVKQENQQLSLFN
ncbi:putative DNA modification/repair radical SAM protein [Sessilibacter corallicola]|uniref:putative DNA modification/repair radical SAM protein n=1 Tax=Sessilibacter corallicola TaxID=2904075 RepID=UPI001E4500BA|nr:putative DNA modification/repair radical SAM protein [Sessilibacter corallicola]MCE2029418.1 putative DNA modification/repair radical SAM protein [Sessilibacter corallicola]